jgi:hypothetical protein
MLRDPTVRVSWSRGVHHRADDAGQWMVAEPTAGETITIDVHGGAVETTETAEERLQRLIDLERAER